MCHSSPYYGKWAYNMAHSIRALSEIKIHLVHDKASTQGIDLSIFDSKEEIEFGNDFGLEKIKVFDRSPFDETLYLDVDGIVINNPDEIFDKLKGSSIWVQPMGKGTKGDNITYTWAANVIVWLRFNLSDETIFNTCQTSIIYFTKEAKKFFERLKENYNDRLEPYEYREMWGLSKQHPDELYYSITLAQMGIDLQEFRPVFFPEKIKDIGIILNDYYVLSMYGGNNVKPYALTLYDRIMQKIMNGFGKNHKYKANKLYAKKFINIK